MSSEQKKFSPELMGGASLFSRIRKALSSVLDIGKSARVRLSRMTDPDYDAISDILKQRDEILGAKFVSNEQKKAPPRDVFKEKYEMMIRKLVESDKLKMVGDEVIYLGPDSNVVNPDVVEESESDDVVEPEVPKVEDATVPAEEKVVEPELQIIDTVLESVDEEGTPLRPIDDWVVYSVELFEDDIEGFVVRNVISIMDHDIMLEQMLIDDPMYSQSEESALKFPEVRPVIKQTTLDVEIVEPKEEPVVPWYTDEDLIWIGIRAATEDCIETITPMMEAFDEPEVIDEPDIVDIESIDMAVKAMTRDSIESIIIRMAQAAKAAQSIVDDIATIDEPVIETPIEDVPDIDVKGVEPVVDQITRAVTEASAVIDAVEVSKIDEPVFDTDLGSTVGNTFLVEQVYSESTSVPDDVTDQPGASISFKFGSGAAGSGPVGIRFRFGIASQ